MLYLRHVHFSNIWKVASTRDSPLVHFESSTLLLKALWWSTPILLAIWNWSETWHTRGLFIRCSGMFSCITSRHYDSWMFLSVLHHSFTPMASRLLRANILSPITRKLSPLIRILSWWWSEPDAINARLDVVEGWFLSTLVDDPDTCLRTYRWRSSLHLCSRWAQNTQQNGPR